MVWACLQRFSVTSFQAGKCTEGRHIIKLTFDNQLANSLHCISFRLDVVGILENARS